MRSISTFLCVCGTCRDTLLQACVTIAVTLRAVVANAPRGWGIVHPPRGWATCACAVPTCGAALAGGHQMSRESSASGGIRLAYFCPR